MARHGIDALRELMSRLRDPRDGCPWDLSQDWKSLLGHTLEEVYELADAVERNAVEQVRDELGDYLFQAVFYAQIAAERGLFDFDDATDAIVAKLLKRHPHVFPDGTLASRRPAGAEPDRERINATWEQIKQGDRRERAQHGVLDDVPLALPGLQRAAKLQKRAAGVGFDWPAVDGVYAKLEEEIAELREAARCGSVQARSDELGDLLFTCVNLARHLDVDAEQALRAANAKFERRFRAMESEVGAQGRALGECDAATLDSLWNSAKARERT